MKEGEVTGKVTLWGDHIHAMSARKAPYSYEYLTLRNLLTLVPTFHVHVSEKGLTFQLSQRLTNQ